LNKINLRRVVEQGLSEGVHSVYLFAGLPPLGNKGHIMRIGENVLSETDVRDILEETATGWQYGRFKAQKEIEYSYDLAPTGRFRISAFFRNGKIGLVIRPIPSEIPTLESLGVPPVLKDLARKQNGLVLITGPSRSGKSTTLAAIVDFINMERACHIVTIEDVIEFLHHAKKSIISQREIGRDTQSLSEALRRVLREDPNVVVVGDIRDEATMMTAIKLAETGQLVFGTMHTNNAVQTVNRIVDLFPESEKNQVRALLAQILEGVVSQRLLPRRDGKGFICASEVMLATQPVRSLIREDKMPQIFSVMDISKREGMVSMDDSLRELYRQGMIGIPEMIRYSSKGGEVMKKVASTAPGANHLMTGERFLDLDRAVVLYRAEFRSGNLMSFDASGNLLNTPPGLLFREAGYAKREFHYVADYTMMRESGAPIPLKSLFNLSYKINDTRLDKPFFGFQVRAILSDGQEAFLPQAPLGLKTDRAWHSLAVPIPQLISGKLVKYYMLLFDSDIREIIFDDICFS
jgi:twitching motility protein PilT